MQSSLKKSLYLGLAALSFAGVAAVSTTASAKSYAKAGAYSTLTTKAETRNVQATGSNALYTKPGTVKGAKVVASKATMAKLADSKKSANYFRAYGVKTTNRGSVYYRVVTMDGKYRGYIYGGKSDTAFAGGIKSAETTKTATTPAKTTGYYLKDASKNTLWTAPKYTQYKASKVNLYGATAQDPFKVDSAATKTQEGSLYYHVTDTKDASISGWIYAGKGFDASITDNTKQDLGGLSLNVSDATATNDNSVKIVYRDANKAQVGTATWITNASDTKAGNPVGTNDVNAANTDLATFAANQKPDGYALVTSPVVTTNAQYGNTLYVDVVSAATSKVSLKTSSVVSDTTTATDPVEGAATTVKLDNPLTSGTTLTAKDLSLNLSANGIAALTGDKTALVNKGANFATLTTDLTGKTTPIEGSVTYYGTKTAKNTTGEYHYVFTFDADGFSATNGSVTFGNNLTANYSAQVVAGPATAASTNNNWIA